MPQPFDYAKLLQDPNFEENFLKGLAQGQALLQTAQDTPMQPPVEGIPPPDVSMRFSQTTLPESDKEIQKLIRQKYLESIGQQEESTKTAKEMLAKEMKRQEQLGALGKLDLRPFAQAVRQYGSTMAVVPAEAPESGQEMLAKLRAEVQKGQQALSADQINFLKTMMEDKRAGQLGMSMRNAQARETKEVTTQLYKLGTAAEDYNKDIDLIRDIVEADEIPVRKLKMIVTKVGKTLGEVGTQTDTDRLSYYKDTIEAYANDLATRFGINGKIDPNDPSIKAIKEVMSTAQKEAGEALGNKANLYKDMMSAEGSPFAPLFKKGASGDVGYTKIMNIVNKSTLQPTESPPQGAGVMSEEQKKKLQELRAKYPKTKS